MMTKKPMKMDFLLLQCGIGNGKIILLKSSSTNGTYSCISDEIVNLKLSLYVVKCFNQVYDELIMKCKVCNRVDLKEVSVSLTLLITSANIIGVRNVNKSLSQKNLGPNQL